MINEAAHMVQLGIAPMEEIDQMMRMAANFPSGPFEWADQIGLDRVLGMRALDEGLADAAHIDQTIKDGGGFRMGPLELRDLVGLEVGLKVTSSLYRRLGHEKFKPPECLRERVAADQLGRKTERGFYTYNRKSL